MSEFINKFKCSTYNEFKEKLMNTFNVVIKEDDNLSIIYESSETDKEKFPLKNCIIDKNTLKIVSTQFENIKYNEDAMIELKKLSSEEWNKCKIQESIEGTIIVVFFKYDKWYITTRRCLDASKSFWIRNKSYKDLFIETLNNKNIEDFDKQYVYFFVLVNHENKNIIDYTEKFGYNYKKIIHIGTYDENLNEINIDIGIEKPEYLKFSCPDELEILLIKKSNEDILNKKISIEGYIIDGKYKLQTKLYEKISKIKPNFSNINSMYLVLYQNDNLKEYIKYINEDKHIILRINNAFKIMCSELLNLYHITRNKKSPKIYEQFEFNYKKALYEIHGIFLKQKQSINIHDVYNYLKHIDPKQLISMFKERKNLLSKIDILNTQNIDMNIQMKLMFPD